MITSKREINKTGFIYPDTGRILKWTWGFGLGVKLYAESGDCLAHGDLHSLDSWANPEIIILSENSIDSSEESAFMNVLNELASYEYDNFKCLENGIDKIINTVDSLNSQLLNVYDWAFQTRNFESRECASEAVDQLMTDFILRSVVNTEFTGKPDDIELTCHEECCEAVWTIAFDKVTGYLQSLD